MRALIRYEYKSPTDLGQDKAPLEGAELVPVTYWDCRTFKSPEEFDEKLVHNSIGRPSEPWFSIGSDHSVITGPRGGVLGIKRRMDRDYKAWRIELTIELIEHLLNEVTGDVDISNTNLDDGGDDNLCEMTIYVDDDE